jgi:hypothetical protein
METAKLGGDADRSFGIQSTAIGAAVQSNVPNVIASNTSERDAMSSIWREQTIPVFHEILKSVASE